jgi:hypothetical protein
MTITTTATFTTPMDAMMELEPGYTLADLVAEALPPSRFDTASRQHGRARKTNKDPAFEGFSNIALNLLRDVFVALARRTPADGRGIVVTATSAQLGGFSARKGQPKTKAQARKLVYEFKELVGEQGLTRDVVRGGTTYRITFHVRGDGEHWFWFVLDRMEEQPTEHLVSVPNPALAERYNLASTERERAAEIILAAAADKGVKNEARAWLERIGLGSEMEQESQPRGRLRTIGLVLASCVVLALAAKAAYTFVPPFRRLVQRYVPILRPAPRPSPPQHGHPSSAAIDVTPPRVTPNAPTHHGAVLHGAAAGKMLYVAHGTRGVEVYDIGNPDHPHLVRTIPTTDASAVVARDPYLFVADGSAGVRVIDLRKPSAEATIALVPTTGHDNGISLGGDFAYVASGMAGLRIFDIRTPERTRLIAAATDAPTGQVGSATAVMIRDNVAFIAQEPGPGNFGGGLVVVDVSQPTAPVVSGQRLRPSGARAVLPLNAQMVLLAEPDGLWLVDISQRAYTSPTISVVKDIRALVALDTTKVLAISAADIAIFDITNPSAPTRLPDETPLPSTVLAGAGIAYLPHNVAQTATNNPALH